jgi:hypothetical protein
MTAGGVPEKVMIAYLLGELSEEEQSAFERACLGDDGIFEELLAVEAELTDDYVRGDLVGPRRTAFEKRLLNSPDSAKQLRLARLITRNGPSRSIFSAKPLQTTRASKSWSIAWLSAPNRFIAAGAAAVVVVGISVGLLMWKKQGFQTSARVAPTPPPTSSQGAALSPPSAASPSPSKSNFLVATFVITGDGERDTGSVNEIKIPAHTGRVQLRVDLAGNQYSSYRASLQTIGGQTRLSLPDVKASPVRTGQTLTIQLPATDLPPGDSILTVTGVPRNDAPLEVVGKYFIRRLQ